MILKKVIENNKEIYVPISFEEAVKIYDKTQLVFLVKMKRMNLKNIWMN